MTEQIEDDFWAEERARDTAARGKHADPAGCDTCKASVAAGGQVKHDECAQRATLLPAPDAPAWELITGLSEEELAALPARFHVPAFIESCTPKAWVCAVCWGDGWNTQWPCKTATEQGLHVFTPEHVAETAAKRQTSRIAELEARVAELEAELNKYVGHEPTIAEEMAYLSRCFHAVHDVCDEAEQQATRWEHPLPVPEWVATLRAAASGERPDDPADNRRRIYIDGKGNGWISTCSEEGTEYVVPVEPAAHVEQSVDDIAHETGSLREIGRCW